MGQAARAGRPLTGFAEVRDGWLDAAGLDGPEWLRVIPSSAVGSVELLSYRVQAERAGMPLEVLVAERLARAGASVDELPDLAAEAEIFLRRARRETPQGPVTSQSESCHPREGTSGRAIREARNTVARTDQRLHGEPGCAARARSGRDCGPLYLDPRSIPRTPILTGIG